MMTSIKPILNAIPNSNVLSNLLLQDKEGKNHQIDYVVFNHAGIWVINVQNQKGTIIGSDEDSKWTNVLAGGKKQIDFASPVKINESSIKVIQDILSSNIIFSNVVVFPKANLQNLNSEYVIPLNELPYIIANSSSLKYPLMKSIDSLYEKLRFANIRNASSILQKRAQKCK